MWYECIPSMAIITVMLSLSNVVVWGVHKVGNGGNVSNDFHSNDTQSIEKTFARLCNVCIVLLQKQRSIYK